VKVLRVIFALYTVVCALGAITGIQAIHGGHIFYFHGWHRALPFLAGTISGALYLGLTKSQIWAWHVCRWLGYLMVLQILVYNAVMPAIAASDAFFRFWILGSQTLFAGIVFWIVLKWWEPKKALFTRPPKTGT
jgi:peptidoglycan/LPS O-acetylase OafA/YrhL